LHHASEFHNLLDHFGQRRLLHHGDDLSR
jgi:hypothetical protein